VHFIGLVGALVLPTIAAATDGFGAASEPTQVAGGVEVGTCGYPTAVAMRGDGWPFCTGTLVHPQVVLFAAHCIDPEYGWTGPVSVGFGENGFEPVADIPAAHCDWHPGWDQGNAEGFDVAYCVLSQAVDLDVVPPLMGCEWDAMVPGVETHIVGFGADVGILDPLDGWIHTEGNGPKRTAPQILEGVVEEAAYLLGNQAGGCPGDSGGPAMVRMADGTWRVIGAASRIHPDTPPTEGNACLYGTVYSTFAHTMPWLEDQTGIDLTPCHDAMGSWDPDERCGGMPLSPGDPTSTSGTWMDGCAGSQLSGLGELCGPPFDGPVPPPPPPPEPPPPPPEPPPPPPPEPPPPLPPPVPPDDSGIDPFPGGTASDDGGSMGSDDDAGLGDDGGFADRGCGCQTDPGGAGQPWWLWGLPLLGLRRRRRRRRG